MTKTAEAGELAKHLMEFLDDVKDGHEVLVTGGQEPVARLVPMHSPAKRPRRSVLHLRSLPGKWIGEPVIQGSDLADEILDTQYAALLHTHGVKRLFTNNADDFRVFGVFELVMF